MKTALLFIQWGDCIANVCGVCSQASDSSKKLNSFTEKVLFNHLLDKHIFRVFLSCLNKAKAKKNLVSTWSKMK